MRDLVVLAEEEYCPHQQVVKVQAAVLLEDCLVTFVDSGSDLLPVGRRLVIVRADQFVLGFRDSIEHGPGAIPFVIQIQFLERLPRHGQLVTVVKDDEIADDVRCLVLAAQDADADGVERANGQAIQLRADEPGQPGAHLPGCLVGERHGHDAPWLDAALPHQVSHAVSEHPRLAAARPGQHQNWSACRLYRLLLGGIQSVEDVHSVPFLPFTFFF